MYVNFTYNDLDYGTSDSIIIALPDDTDFRLLEQKLTEFFNLYIRGYEFSEEYLNSDLTGLEEDVAEDFAINFPNLSVEDAIFFAKERENGLSSDLVAKSFLSKHPEFNGNLVTFDHEIILDEYHSENRIYE